MGGGVNILAIDLGTTTGWALRTRDGVIRSGSRSCAVGTLEGRGQRWLKFRALLNELDAMAGEINAVYFEDVKNHSAVLAAHVYGGFHAHLETWCELRRLRLVGVGVGTVKKNWTGAGNAKKPDMIAEARRRGFAPVDDNHADALAILALSMVLEKVVKVVEPQANFFEETAA